MTASSTPELSRIIQLADLNQKKKLVLDIQASKEECQALAKRMDIPEVKSLQAKVTIKLSHTAGNFRIDGHIKADLVQLCGVTFQPVNEKIDETFAETLTTIKENLSSDEDEITGDDDIPVDLVKGDSFDVGESVAQWLTLFLNPYPRSDAPEYAYNETSRTEEGEPTHTPFDVLGQLKKQENDI